MQVGPETEVFFKLSLPARPERLALIRSVIQRTAQLAGCNDEVANLLVIAVNEACMNIIQHAYQGDTSGQYVIEVSRKGPSLYFRLEDYARPIDLEKVRPRELDDVRPGGLGVHFIRQIMDTYSMGHLQGGQGNYLEMSKNIQ